MEGRDCDIKCKHAMDVPPNWRAKCSKVLQDIHGIVTKWSKRSLKHFLAPEYIYNRVSNLNTC